MSLLRPRRPHHQEQDDCTGGYIDEAEIKSNKSALMSRYRSRSALAVTAGLAVLAMAVVFSPSTRPELRDQSQAQNASAKASDDQKGYHRVNYDLSPTAAMSLQLIVSQDGNTRSFGSGPHFVKVVIQRPTVCPFPRFWIRLKGAILIPIYLVQDIGDKAVFEGSFNVPVSGKYIVDTRWYGCNKESGLVDSSLSTGGTASALHFLVESQISAQARSATSSDSASLFPFSAWVAGSKIPPRIKPMNAPTPAYVWRNVELASQDQFSDESAWIALQNTILEKEATAASPNNFYEFIDLGNYELVCFMGSATMDEIRSTFLAIRSNIFPSQRPFKFHYYNVTSFVHPDQDWNLERKRFVRKCKHLLVSIDEMTVSLSQKEYREQIVTFIGHLLKLMNDDTFPIWIFTVNEPAMSASNCHTPFLPRTTEHPCNDVLKELFAKGKRNFPSRVRLLDNTDITGSNWDGDNRRPDILAVIALRIFVFVGKQVSDWRAAGQKGLIDGLHRNGTVEPNFDLIPYEGWN